MSDDLAIDAARPPRAAQSSADPVLARMDGSRDGGRATSSPNANYQRDMRYVFKPSSWFLGTIGIWPLAIRGYGPYLSKIAIVCCNLALGFAIVPCALHIAYDEEDLNLRLKLSGLLGFCATAMMKYCVLAIRRPKIQRCIEYVKNDWWQVGVAEVLSGVHKIHAVRSTNERNSLPGDVEMYVSAVREVD